MIVWMTAVELLATFIEQIIFFRITALVFQKKYIWKTAILAAVGAAVVVVCNQQSMFSWLTMMITVAYDCIAGFALFRQKWLSIFSISCLYLLCLGCLDFLVASLLAFTQGGTDFLQQLLQPGMPRVLFIAVIKAVWIVLFLVVRYFIRRMSPRTDKPVSVLFLSIGGYIGFVYLAHQTFANVSENVSNTWFIFFSLIVLILFVILLGTELREKRLKIDYEEMRNRMLEEKYQGLNDVYEKNAELYHDLNHHMNALYQMLDTGDLDGAKGYIKEISEPIQSLSREIWTGVDIVDAIINSKIKKMDEMGINHSVQAEFPFNTDITSSDICAVLSNLLDNAIDASEKVLQGEREVRLVMRRIHQFLMIRVENRCINQSLETEGLPKTSKVDSAMHGWGLRSVNNVARKYGGSLTCSLEDGIFRTDVLLFFSAQDK